MSIRTGLAALAMTIAATLGHAQETAPAAVGSAAPVTIPDMTLGNPDAPVKIVEYASFTCPHCATFHAEVFKPLKTDYIDTGKVSFTFREVYFDRYGLWGAMLARCGGEMRYFGISSILLETQEDWAASDDPAVVIDNLKRIGRSTGIADADLQACFDDKATAEAMVAKFQADTTADGVEGTPTIFINGEKHPNMSYDELRAIIDPLLAE